jgi:uncharacterized Zn finger protein
MNGQLEPKPDGDYCKSCGADLLEQREILKMQGVEVDDLDQCQDCGAGIRHLFRSVQDHAGADDTIS